MVYLATLGWALAVAFFVAWRREAADALRMEEHKDALIEQAQEGKARLRARLKLFRNEEAATK